MSLIYGSKYKSLGTHADHIPVLHYSHHIYRAQAANAETSHGHLQTAYCI